MSFSELAEAFLKELKSQKYMESTLTVYCRSYNRIHVYFRQHSTAAYTHESGKMFLSFSSICRSIFTAYACTVRRLDDCMVGNTYRCHHGVCRGQAASAFLDVLARFVQDYAEAGNKPATLLTKESTYVLFLSLREKAGCSSFS